MGNRLVINTVNFSTPKTHKKDNKIKQTPSFKGAGAAAIVNVMQSIENGGVAATFTIQDFLGLNIPRTIYNLFRNKDVTGELNKQASLETGIREFVTGPSMMAIPAVIFAVTKNVFGKASDIKFPLLRRIGEHFEEISHTSILNNDLAKTNESLYNSIIKNTLDNTFGKENVTKEELKTLTDKALKLKKEKKNLSKMSRSNKEQRRLIKENIKKLEEEILDTIAEKNKKLGVNISTPRTVKFSATNPNTHEAVSVNFKSILKSLDKYSKDVVEKTINKVEATSKKSIAITEKNIKEFIKNTNLKRIGGRFFSTSLAVLSIGGFSYFIPKLYSRSEKPPGEVGLETGGANASK